jgi:phage tail-like protein
LTAAIAVVAVVVVSAQSDQRRSPLPAYYFQVEINGIVYPFKSCSGLKIESEVVEYQEGGNTGSIRKLIA